MYVPEKVKRHMKRFLVGEFSKTRISDTIRFAFQARAVLNEIRLIEV